MSEHRGLIAVLLATLVASGASFPALAQGPELTAPPEAGDATGMDVLTRGPVHEAFAEPVSAGREAGVLVPKRPPEPIEEIPPDNKPDAANVAWIPGYWAWDEDRKDYLWVSGVWRVPPENRTWVPGYWADAPGGSQWVSGFWLPAQSEEMAYLPEPPATLEAGPSSPAPSSDQFWVPGHWSWRETRYAWQPGFWSDPYPQWVWVPAHYCWTPRGWVFVDGYWDYPLAGRGLLFAPVYFSRPIYRGPRFYYSPGVVIDPHVLTVHLFVRPHYCHYYFGDWYAPSYVHLGFRPWFMEARIGFDPLFTYYRWYHERHRHEPDWSHNLRGWHQYYERHADMRPPHTIAAQTALHAKGGSRPDMNLVNIGAPLKDFSRRRDAPVHLTAISEQQRQDFRRTADQFRDFNKERGKLESHPHGGLAGQHGPEGRAKIEGKPGAKAEQVRGPDRVKLPGNLPKIDTATTSSQLGRKPGSDAGAGARIPGGPGKIGSVEPPKATLPGQTQPPAQPGVTGQPFGRGKAGTRNLTGPGGTTTVPGGTTRTQGGGAAAGQPGAPSVTSPLQPSGATGSPPSQATTERGRLPSITAPQTTQGAKPQGVQSGQPQGIQSTQPQTIPGTRPKNIQGGKPPSIQSTPPQSIQSTQPPAIQSTQPPAIQRTRPQSVPGGQPPTTQSTKPQGIPSTKPQSIQSTKPQAVQGGAAPSFGSGRSAPRSAPAETRQAPSTKKSTQSVAPGGGSNPGENPRTREEERARGRR